MFRCGQEEIAEVTRVLESKQWFRIGNPDDGHLGEVDKFEAEWAQLIGSKYALLMCGGGTASRSASAVFSLERMGRAG